MGLAGEIFAICEGLQDFISASLALRDFERFSQLINYLVYNTLLFGTYIFFLADTDAQWVAIPLLSWSAFHYSCFLNVKKCHSHQPPPLYDLFCGLMFRPKGKKAKTDLILSLFPRC